MSTDLYRETPALRQQRNRRGKKGRLNINDKISLVHSVLCNGEQQCDVAKMYQVTDGFVS